MRATSSARTAGALSLFALQALAATQVEKLAGLPLGWSMASSAADSTALHLTVGLGLSNLDQLESKLMSQSTPGNAAYGQHMDRDAVQAMFAPDSASAAAVTNWLTSSGVKATSVSTSKDGHWVTFVTTVGTANTLLSTTFAHYKDSKGNVKLRTTGYSVPDELASHIDMITPTTYFGTVKAARAIPKPETIANAKRELELEKRQGFNPNGSCAVAITPQCLKNIYNVGSYSATPSSGSKVGFGSFLNQSAQNADLSQFQTKFNIPQQGFSVQLIAGGVNDQAATIANVGEADLDVEYISGISHPLPITEFITGGSPPFIPNLDEPAGADTNEPYVPYYKYLLSQTNDALPQVISNSYGDDEQVSVFPLALSQSPYIY